MTEGKPSFNRALASEGFTEDEVLRLAASLDQGSEHPLAEAIVRAARERGLVLETHGRSVLLRNTTMLTDAGIETGHMSSQAEPLAHARWEVSRRDWTPGAHPMGLLG